MTAVISDRRSEAFDVNVAHETRRYDYWLGGKDNFAADRASGDLLAAAFPPVRIAAVENRRFGRRVTRYLAADCGISQFLDIGTGIPISSNTHEVAQGANPAARVVYVDNDPFVLVHARALLTSAPEGRTAYIEADLRDPARILNAPEVLDTLDLTQPVALLPGDVKPIVDQLMKALPTGSFLLVTHVTHDFLPAKTIAEHEGLQRAGRSDFFTRPKQEIAELFDGLHIVDPGVVPLSKWRPDPDTEDPSLDTVNAWVAVGRKGPAQAG
jgi:hypothetical protein